MGEQPPPVDRHEAVDRFGKAALRIAHDLGVAGAEGGEAGGDPVVLSRRGPHRSIGGLAALLDAALADDEGAGDTGTGDTGAGDTAGCTPQDT